jgi:omega-amidase
MSKTLTVAIGQMNVALGDPRANLRTVTELARRAAGLRAELLLLPELWGSGYDLERARELATPREEGLFAASADLARQHGMAICGSLLERRADGVYNTATLSDATGARVARYSKVHLFGLMDEGKHLRPGGATPTFDLPWGRTALAICYDLRFPELFRRFALEGTEIMLLPAEWPAQRIEHWRTLLRARAIENQCYVLGCNRVGADRANTFGGRSAVIDPWGATVAEAGEGEELLIATLDLELAAEVRGRIPVFRDRRVDLY